MFRFVFAAALAASFPVCGNTAIKQKPEADQQQAGDAKLHQNIELSEAETLAWLADIDKGRYGESWDRASLMFRNTIKRDEWIKAMKKIRQPRGALISRSNLDIRTSKDPAGLPAGDYMVFFYKSAFANSREAFELATLVQESDGHWRILTYQVN